MFIGRRAASHSLSAITYSLQLAGIPPADRISPEATLTYSPGRVD
jgi:hypothetical protein